MATNAEWGTDTPISMPVPPHPQELKTGCADGFAYTRFGLVHNLTVSDLEEFLIPTYGPLDVAERE